MALFSQPAVPPPARWRRTFAYLSATETHTFAFSIAAHALLSFFPFIVLLLTFSRSVLRSRSLYRGLVTLVGSYLPVNDAGLDHTRSFILNNLQQVVEHHQRTQYVSLVILLVTCTGIFLPLEVALNRIWEAPRNRSYFHNWAVAIGLAFSCGVLGMLSASFTALTETYSTRLAHYLLRHSPHDSAALSRLIELLSTVMIRAGAVPITIAVFFLIYWRVPNVHVSARQALPAAVLAGVLWEISKYLYILTLPWLNFHDVYGPFAISVTLLLWAYVSALILLVGIQLVAVPQLNAPEADNPS